MSVNINIGVTYNGKNIQKSFRDLNTLRKQADTTSDRLKAMGGQARLIGQTMTKAGQSIARNFTLPLIAVGAAAVRSSVDFDTAFTGVIKTVDATEQQLDGLRSGIRKMATELPATASEIANVASAAGQLGIQTDNILGFTRVMIDLGETTNLTADDAATAFARFANILQTPQDQFDRLGSTIVALGNNLATTEGEILELAMRLAAAGGQIGLSEAEILSFAGALSSVGVEAEAGGSALSRVFVEINSAVISGGDNLQSFAAIAGMSAEQFAQAFRDDAAEAIRLFIAGIGRIRDTGGDVAASLDTVGFNTIRLRDALGRAAGAGDLLTNALQLGSQAFDDNVALTREAELRYQSTGAQFEIFRNRVNDAAIEVGDALAPALIDALDAIAPFIQKITDLAEKFSNLDEEQQKNIIKWGAIIAIGAPLAAFALGAIANIIAISTALAAMGATAAVATGGLSLLFGVAAVSMTKSALMTDEQKRLETATRDLRVEQDKLAGVYGAQAQAAAEARRETRLNADAARYAGAAAHYAATGWSAYNEENFAARNIAEETVDPLQEMQNALAAIGEASHGTPEAAGPKVVALTDDLRALFQGLNETHVGAGDAGDAIAQFSREVLAAGNITEDTVRGAERLAQVIRQDIDRSLADANQRLQEATGLFDQFRDAIARGVSAGNTLSDAAGQQTSALEALTRAEQAYADAVASGDEDRIRDAAEALADAEDGQKTFLDFLQVGVTTAEGFAAQIDALREAGASLEVVQQIAELGAKTGGRLAAELLAGGAAAIEQANRMVAAVEDASRRAGLAAAEQFYGAGVNAAKAMVRGIEATIPELQGVLDRIADAIERAMGVAPNVDITGKTGPFIPKTTPPAVQPARPTATPFQRQIEEFDWAGLSKQLGSFGGAVPMADGGIVTSPTFALIGEAGPEAVIPLNSNRGMGGQTIVNVTVTSADPQAVIEAIRRYTRSNGPLGSSVTL